jgi:hypothetical protein
MLNRQMPQHVHYTQMHEIYLLQNPAGQTQYHKEEVSRQSVLVVVFAIFNESCLLSYPQAIRRRSYESSASLPPT